ncbi:MAG TPA: nucleotidyltransferase domain-containing protein [Sphingomicrobium sp.]|nr:nucleotidyltransferase domain-containing protein [Sphingomicrobium sp.]
MDPRDRKMEAIALAQRFVAARHPQAVAALLAGSQANGNATASSDFDIVLLFGSLAQGAWREMAEFEGRDIEVFAHDASTLAYFCRQIDAPSGIPALPTMIVESLIVSGAEHDQLVTDARRLAAEVLDAGPPPLDQRALEMRRFAISELANSLAPGRPASEVTAAGAALYMSLGDFALRAADRWSASGKALPKALAAMEPTLSRDFETAFQLLFETHETQPVQSLVNRVLEPYGGRLRSGFRLSAPAEWRET